jgi:predicted  nucleic acid-binding Zn-ribbon protein
MNFIEKEKSTFLLKSEFVQEKNNILSDISNKQAELKKLIMLNEVQIKTITKDIEDAIYRYDKTIIENLQVPGLVGNGCRFPNLKEYILSNKDEISNAMILNKQTSMEFKSFKKRMENNISQINEKMKSQEYKFNNLITSKFNELKEKFDGLYEALNDKINNISSTLNIEICEKNTEIEKIKKSIHDNKKKLYENDEKVKEELLLEVEGLKKSFHKIKKNIVKLSNLLNGKNTGLNKQMVINSFNHMMKQLFKEYNIVDKINLENTNEIINNINENNNINLNTNTNNDKKVKTPKKIIKNNNISSSQKKFPKVKLIKSNISSSIKDYI